MAIHNSGTKTATQKTVGYQERGHLGQSWTGRGTTCAIGSRTNSDATHQSESPLATAINDALTTITNNNHKRNKRRSKEKGMATMAT